MCTSTYNQSTIKSQTTVFKKRLQISLNIYYTRTSVIISTRVFPLGKLQRPTTLPPPHLDSQLPHEINKILYLGHWPDQYQWIYNLITIIGSLI